MNKILQSRWFVAVLGTVLYLSTTIVLWQTPAIGSPTNGAELNEQVTGPSWEFNNPELDQLIAELKKEREALAQREQALKELAERLQSERAEINTVTQAVHNLQLEFDRTTSRVTEEEAPNLQKLAKIYATMEPAAAAKILKEFDDQFIIKVLSCMKETEIATFLETMSKQSTAQAKRAAEISQRLRPSATKGAGSQGKP